MRDPRLTTAIAELTAITRIGSGDLLGVKDLETLLQSCCQSVCLDIESRTGLKDVWSEISEETKAEIFDTWMLMVVLNISSALKTVSNTSPENLSADHKTKSYSHDLSE